MKGFWDPPLSHNVFLRLFAIPRFHLWTKNLNAETTYTKKAGWGVFSVPWFPLSPPKWFDLSVFWCSSFLCDPHNNWDHLSVIRDPLAFALALPCPGMDDTFQRQCLRHLLYSITPQNGSHSKFMDSPKWSECELGEICYQTTKCKVETPKVVVIDSRSYSQLRRLHISTTTSLLELLQGSRIAGIAAQTKMHQRELSTRLEIIPSAALSEELSQDKCQWAERNGCCIPGNFSFSKTNMHPVYKETQIFLEHLLYCSARPQHDGVPVLCTSWHCKSYKWESDYIARYLLIQEENTNIEVLK